ncbi:MAG: family 10 glycosylhydrolase [Rubrivivax sp.]|nr:family 10 glycosylhydrolase [Rubrivivax sp.]
MIRRQLLAAACTALAGCAELPSEPASAPTPTAPPTPRADTPPPAPREFRAAWVASVANIDWPSQPGLSGQAQRAEALALLDRARTLGLNALILQVRPAGDALYPSALEPWSEVLSGEQGRPPWLPGEPAWDPLAFWVREAHRRGLELHAWFNPYRARASSAKTPLVAPHIGVRQPALVKRYGDQLWMDPGEAAAAAHTLAVVADVVRRYDIDGVHIDDYFYPYPFSVPAVDGVEQPFPDDEAYARYRLGGGLLVREDWRRANVDTLVEALYRSVHAIKPWVRVGISPFGLGRPDRRPAGVTGFSQFDKLYADVERWLDRGWLDYLAPQLYWPIGSAGQPFAPLLDYWLAENRARRHIWPGLFTSQVTRGEPGVALGPKVWPARELLDQVALVRTRAAPPLPGGGLPATGHIHFSMVALMQDRDRVATLLQAGPYAQPALVPASPWLAGQALPAPRLALRGTQVEITPGPGPAATRWAVWRRVGGQWRFAVLPAEQRSLALAGADLLTVTAVDRVGTLGATQRLALP